MIIDLKELKTYPNIMSKEQFCKACHISKRTALFLLENGLIPYIDTGKRTRCYIIRKADVIAFAKKQNSGFNKKAWTEHIVKKEHLNEITSSVRIKMQLPKDPKVIREFYRNKLHDWPDVLSMAQVAEFTGYNRHTVGRWIFTGKLQALNTIHKYMIPKVWLLDLLMSENYSKIVRKTKQHRKMLWELTKRKGGLSGSQEALRPRAK